MEERAERLADYCQDRLGTDLRAVGYHDADDFEISFIREDLERHYPSDLVEGFVEASRHIHNDVNLFDEGMGSPEASLHVLDEGLIVQFHFAGEDVIFLSMDRGVGRNFTQFVSDCFDQMS